MENKPIQNLGYFKIHLEILQKTKNLHQTMVFCYLLNCSNLFGEDQGWFYHKQQKMINNLVHISPKTIQRSVKELEKLGLVETKICDMPAKMYFRVLYSPMDSQIGQRDRSRSVRETDQDRSERLRNIKKNNIKRRNKKTSNDVNVDSDESTKITSNPFLEKWNSYPNCQTHKKKSSKVYQKAAQLIKELQTAKFGTNRKLDMEFLKKHKFRKSALITKWSDEMIYRGLENLSKMFLEHYEPADKSFLNSVRSLHKLIYNPNTKRSWFLACYFDPPKELSEIHRKQIPKEKIKNCFGMIENKFWMEDLSLYFTHNQQITLMENINRIFDYYERMMKVVQEHPYKNYFNRDVSTAKKFFQDFITWLCEHKFQKEELKSWMFRVNTDLWSEFMTFWQEQYYSEREFMLHLNKKYSEKLS